MTPIYRIRVLVKHRDPVVLAGLVVALEECADVQVHSAKSPKGITSSPVELCGWRSADVIIADYETALALAIEAERERGMATAPRIVVVAGMDREWEIRSALEHGVRGYILAGCSLGELVAGVRAVFRGVRHLSPQVAARLADSISLKPLTAREEEVLKLVAQGLCNKEVAKLLRISLGTVKSHVKSMLSKLNVASRTQAIVAVQRRGLLRSSQQLERIDARQESALGSRDRWMTEESLRL